MLEIQLFFTIKLYLHLNCVLILNWIIWNWTVFDIETVLTLNWIVIYNCLNKLNCLKEKCFWQIVYSCLTELFEIELIIYIKMDLALNNLQRSICHKTKPNLTEKYLLWHYSKCRQISALKAVIKLLRSVYNMKFTEECMMGTEKNVLVKIFTNEQSMCFPHRPWWEKRFNRVEMHKISGKEKVPGAKVGKESPLDSVKNMTGLFISLKKLRL